MSGYPPIPAVDAALRRGDRAEADRLIAEAFTRDDGSYAGPLDAAHYERARADATKGRRLADVFCPDCDATIARIYSTPYGPLLRAERPYPEAAAAMRDTDHRGRLASGAGWPYPSMITLEMVADLAAGRRRNPDTDPAPLHCPRHGRFDLPDGQALAEVLAAHRDGRRPRIRARRSTAA